MSNYSQILSTLTPEQKALFERRLKEKGLTLPQSSTIPRLNQTENIPLSFAQQRLWFIQQLEPDSYIYNVPCVLKMHGNLQLSALESAINQLRKRHETLRTYFPTNSENQPIQIIEPWQPITLQIIDTTEEIEKIALTAAQTPFDLTQPLFKTSLFRLAENEHILLITTHHIISDRWSVGVFLKEISLLYSAYVRGEAAPLSELPIQYADWALWQRQQLQGAFLEEQINYWQQKLGGELPVLQLPTLRKDVSTYSGSQYTVALSPSLSQALKTLAAKQSVTLFMLLLASFQVLLYRYTGEEDLLIGTDIVNRDRQETENLIGLLVNTVVLRTNLDGNPTVAELLKRVREVTLGAFAHQHLPFEKLVEVLNPERHLNQMMPLFQVKFDLQLATVQPPQLTGLSVERLPINDDNAKYELRLNLQDTPQGIKGQFEYSSELFDAATIAQIAEHWQMLLESIVTNIDAKISDLSLLTAQEAELLNNWNATSREYPTHECIHELFAAQVERTPDAIALIFGEEAFTYREINIKANQLAYYLQTLGVKPETPVGICLERSPEMVIGMLAILKAGGFYVPLDPAYPDERLQYILDDAKVEVMLTQRRKDAKEEKKVVDLGDWESVGEYPVTNPVTDVTPGNLAYLIYTSGSTGKPKGVMIEHRSPVCLLYWAREVFCDEAISGVLAATSICFDLSVFEIFVPLCWGGKVILAENALELPNLPAKYEVTLINTVPSAITQLLNFNAIPHSVNTVNLAGEPLTWKLVQQLQQLPHVQHIYNLYGPSEDTTYSTYIELKDITPNSPTPPIGRAIANTQVYILDKHLQPVPVGVPGELYIAGAGVARGYWQRPELTAERFINQQSTVNSQQSTVNTLYKTGDRVRYLPDGNIEYLGRLDNQVKIRGYRIELGEIDALLSQYPEIQESVVIASETSSGDKNLVAYIAPKNINIADLRHYLTDKLPGYMIPAHFMTLDALPRNPNGKIDRKALPAVENLSSELGIGYVAPRTATEQALEVIWREILLVEPIGIYDNFFTLGGHSLLGMQLVARINESLQVELPLKYLFQFPTIASLAAQIDLSPTRREALTFPPSLVGKGVRGLGFGLPKIQPQPQERYQPFPLTDIQQAYLIGRNAAFELGNIATHGYQEIETVGLSVAQVEMAMQRLIERHDMLRVIVQADGQQKVLSQVPDFKIAVTDLRGVASALQDIRQRLSHQVRPTDSYPLFEIQAILLNDNKTRFCISFDVLIGDAWSFRLLGRELVQIMENPEVELPPINLTFRDYVLTEKTLQDSAIYHRSQAYWQNRLTTLPPAPELPLTKPLSKITEPHFTRRSGTLSPTQWQKLKQQASEAGITPSGILLAAFAKILSRWSKQPNFTLNLTLFNRLPLHPEVNQIVGDFTASLLLEMKSAGCNNFLELAHRIQSQLWDDLDHRYFSGVEVLRQLARQQQRVTEALMPVVFTSTLTQDYQQPEDNRNWQGELIYSLSQTSQVYFDHQVGEVAGALVFNWDTIDELFPPGMLDEMFRTYCNFLNQLVEPDTNHIPLPPAPCPPASCLQTLFFQQVAKQPNQTAIVTTEQTLTYQQVSDRVCHLAEHLQQLSVIPNQLVAIVMDKGWEQIVAALAILTAGAAYVPIDPQLPAQRRLHLLQETQAQIILTQSWLDTTLEWADHLTRICVDLSPNLSPTRREALTSPSDSSDVEPILNSPPSLVGKGAGGLGQPTDLAYVIYTSGSTGTPKGVMIDHQGAVNTILDINQRFGVTENDRVLAVSSLSFDLSVYDIFGILAAGGTIIIPKSGNDPTHWMQLINQHQVTIWNTVPALMQLLLDTSPTQNQTLRLILLSGDWIPLTLPPRIRSQFNHPQIISLGGATEASIWSIFYPIETIDPNWKSIPYGYSLTNQQVYVLNHSLEPCPTWAIGEIYISGLGVAKGYWQNPELTAEKFIQLDMGENFPPTPLHPYTPTPLYKTGDLGRYLSDGTIEFLGREDFQVKINGYRIELGEIEAALQQHPAITQAVVTTAGNALSQQQLVAYLVLQPEVIASQNTLNSSSQLDFKLQQKGVRKFDAGVHSVALPGVKSSQVNLRRQSYRQFLAETIPLNALGEFFECLQMQHLENSPLPKYRYASAGSLYPVQTYIYIKPHRVENLAAGFYYYHPQKHQLIQLSDETNIDSSIYGINQEIFTQAAFAIFLIGDLQAISPVYGDKSRDFCLLEAGYMGQLLMETAPNQNLGLCPIGDLEFDAIREHFILHEQQIFLHGFVGGIIDPHWTTRWLSPETAQTKVTKAELITQKLRQFLQQRLPEYMIPRLYIPLETLPLTPNGKIDRRALPQPEYQFSQSEQPIIPPSTELEIALAQLWQSILNVEVSSIHNNFFELGGNSLSATQIITQMRQNLQLDLPIREFFLNPTLTAQAELLKQQWEAKQEITIEPIERINPQELLANLDELSDEEVEILLQKMQLEEDDLSHAKTQRREE
ncbi:non-ribosomal peptide synthetase [Anabaena sp. FACHB-709]|uniref:Non-ribosomal peptide synthetase n=2 Tax=Nostocaceae TaxID=1162 RepID=A0ABR7ZBD2_ANACY|nr:MULTISPECIES: non-ribosomal peptide synthetase [Nostocaceae]MBD2169659.1 non-ribosomal peptide synthetase [Anabaena cylindrica FACHB-318]MBD2261922.1 non-ribosomal peptide synthetase [Anabaena sp. FACHB-709]MBD2271507.1 non-ribosomal peptide synthetase [Nostoc sp. PCC 7120 = FACHB-418]MBD2282223.1 non-ribosomal peptide synthetase [Anabaena cylindrica FACHB-170]MBD2351230.1 non-ribosomal peptide synthetase [Trichormus variabilis FACHB-171]